MCVYVWVDKVEFCSINDLPVYFRNEMSCPVTTWDAKNNIVDWSYNATNDSAMNQQDREQIQRNM
jgi:hypothetical protein